MQQPPVVVGLALRLFDREKMSAELFRKYLDLLSEEPNQEPETQDETQDEIEDELIRSLDAQIKDLTPDLLPVTPPDEGDPIVAYTTPRQQRDVLQNPDRYQWGTDKPKDSDLKRPLITKDNPYMTLRGQSDYTTPQGMPTDRIHGRTGALGIDRNKI